MTAKAKRVRTSAPKRSATRRARLERQSAEACRALHQTAHAWVSSVREKIAEVVQAGYALDLAVNDADGPAHSVAFLSCVVDLRAVNALVRQLEAAEQTAARLLVHKGRRVPYIVSALREANEALRAASFAE